MSTQPRAVGIVRKFIALSGGITVLLSSLFARLNADWLIPGIMVFGILTSALFFIWLFVFFRYEWKRAREGSAKGYYSDRFFYLVGSAILGTFTAIGFIYLLYLFIWWQRTPAHNTLPPEISHQSNSIRFNPQLAAQFCNQPPQITDIGAAQYPSHPDYAHLSNLGPIFTAIRCGEERMKKVMGESQQYTQGLTIWQNRPNADLADTLEELDFQCISSTVEMQRCTHWRLNDAIHVNELWKLEQYSDFLQRDDCVRCG